MNPTESPSPRPAGPPPGVTGETPDVLEHGAGGKTADTRLFMQLQAFTAPPDYSTPKPTADSAPTPTAATLQRDTSTTALQESLQNLGLPAVLYDDLHDPRGVGVLTMSQDPADLVGPWRDLLQQEPWAGLTLKPGYTMTGRTYSLGYERDLDETLLHRPARHALHPDWPWAVWYPLRRKPAFERLPRDERMAILKEHGTIGMGFGAADLAHDVRLACHGLDPRDNDFVVGLMGQDLAPLSKLVQRMRATQQTSQWLESLGPFFVGRKVWGSKTTSMA